MYNICTYVHLCASICSVFVSVFYHEVADGADADVGLLKLLKGWGEAAGKTAGKEPAAKKAKAGDSD